uniref:Uncharacterized protein n=1 Tax=Scytodes thoracica TaxID=1112478 RepID=A0A0A0VCL4_SCYTH|nr:hypothetical protein [Scytodes thoracica]
MHMDKNNLQKEVTGTISSYSKVKIFLPENIQITHTHHNSKQLGNDLPHDLNQENHF